MHISILPPLLTIDTYFVWTSKTNLYGSSQLPKPLSLLKHEELIENSLNLLSAIRSLKTLSIKLWMR